ncbi:hypothetical protein V496_03691 [Pseudogymnoascus sp. VKM F-4515 (FW-2607)]|nr:hypothetical protein V496_03691 [Pseudogymnoascus sp. VKM F-4515 (FW-2607)]
MVPVMYSTDPRDGTPQQHHGQMLGEDLGPPLPSSPKRRHSGENPGPTKGRKKGNKKGQLSTIQFWKRRLGMPASYAYHGLLGALQGHRADEARGPRPLTIQEGNLREEAAVI